MASPRDFVPIPIARAANCIAPGRCSANCPLNSSACTTPLLNICVKARKVPSTLSVSALKSVNAPENDLKISVICPVERDDPSAAICNCVNPFAADVKFVPSSRETSIIS